MSSTSVNEPYFEIEYRFEAVNELDIVKFIAIQRLEWAAHLIRLDDNRITHRQKKKILVTRPYGTRKRGKSSLRWKDLPEKDVNTINVRNWKSQAKNRKAWNWYLIQNPQKQRQSFEYASAQHTNPSHFKRIFTFQWEDEKEVQISSMTASSRKLLAREREADAITHTRAKSYLLLAFEREGEELVYVHPPFLPSVWGKSFRAQGDFRESSHRNKLL
ncbi:hypothetical protein TNCV_2003261 [Trichonephila clavipes]|nr:hypothetical protein TNCV_2003261 [Trichonephila clavipes]